MYRARTKRPRQSPRGDPPPPLPVEPDDDPRPARWRAAPLADRVLVRLRSEGESTLAEVLGGFDAEEWCDVVDALDELVRDGRLVEQIVKLGIRPPLAWYRIR
jgi:hypothetical protein